MTAIDEARLSDLLSRCVVTAAGCWEWAGAKTFGYGRININGRSALAHRIAFLASGREIPRDLELDHLCVNPACINPDHLEPVTHAENARRVGLRKTHCANGHEFTPENTRRRPISGHRYCGECSRARQRKATS